MVSRARLKARKEAEAEAGKTAHVLKGSEAFPFGSVMRTRLEQFEQNKGLIKINNIASYDGKGINISSLIACLHILTDPTHKENRWSCLVEMVKYDNDIYLRLVPSIPLEVKKKWEATGKPPRQIASNDVGFILEILKKALSPKPARKPPARKAKKVSRKPSAKKPESPVEQTPEQKQKESVRKNLAIAMEIFKARGSRW